MTGLHEEEGLYGASVDAVDVRNGRAFGLSPRRVQSSSVSYLCAALARRSSSSSSSRGGSTETETETETQKEQQHQRLRLCKMSGTSPTDSLPGRRTEPLSPAVYSEEPPVSFESAFAQAADMAKSRSGQGAGSQGGAKMLNGEIESSRQDSAGGDKAGADQKGGPAGGGGRRGVEGEEEAANVLKRAQNNNLEADLIAASAASRFTKSMKNRTMSNGLPKPATAEWNESYAEEEAKVNRASGGADGIGGTCIGTAATGDLGATTEFPTLAEIREQVAEYEAEFAARHPGEALSGRIIHVSHYIPFVIRALAEVDFERKREEKVAATASVAAMAAAARARKAARQAALAAEAGGGNETDSQHGPRKGSFLEGMSDTTDMEKRLAENQARSKMRAGRRAWMMTPVVDEEDDESDSAAPDRFTPVGSRRNSTWSEASGRHLSFTSTDNRFSAVSDENSPMRTPRKLVTGSPPPPPPPPPQWVLAPRRGHTALNSGIRSLCATHAQTFVGWPGDIHFAAQALNDERKDASQTTDEERRQIEDVLSSLDDARNWAAQDAPVTARAADGQSSTTPKADGGETRMSRVPTPLMNGAEPIQSGVNDKDAAGRNDANGEPITAHGIKYVPVWLDNAVAHGHYEGYCKTHLWPLFHYLLWQDVPGDRRVWDDYSWEAYVAANEAYAQRVAEQYRPGDLVWVHDYHLLLVPQMLRKLVPDAHIGLFIHAPFPSSEIFRCLPQRGEIIEGMLGADLACFQAFSYSRHFLSSCIRVCGLESSANSVESTTGHVTNVAYNPIGIDAAKIAKDCTSPGVMPKIEAIREMYRGKKVIVGRDKLDVVRGVIQKLQAFHKLLEEFPEWRDNVVLIQVTAPSLNDSPILERQVSELVSHINGEFGSLSFTPVHHYHQIIERDEYFALLSVADLAIVSSLRDGMTASTMEYVVAQHMLGSKAPLLLSEFTGSAGRLRSAIQINPWATFSCAKAINYALKMPHEERESRHDDLYHQVVSHTSHTWAASLVKLLVQRILGEQSAHFTPPLNRSLLVQRYKEAGKRMFLLDYDGTLTPIVKDPEAALPSKKLLEALQKLTSDERNIVYVISGRDETFLSKHLGHFERMGFSAEHGGYMREPGSKTWINLTKELDMSWMNDIKGVFEYFTERTSGANIEMKKSSITWHYRNADPDYGVFQAKECQAHLDNLVAQQGLAIEVLVGKKNLECRPLAVNKGEIVKRILYHHADTELVFCAGDDRTDEDMFRTLCNLSPNFPGSDSPSTSANDSLDSPGPELSKKLAEAHHEEAKLAPGGGNKLGLIGPNSPGTPPTATHHQQPLVVSPPAPLSAATPMGSPKLLKLRPDAIFTTTIGANGKKTLAHWHVDEPQKVIDALAEMAGIQEVPMEEGDNTL
ncbi:hypothetical protein FA10DRAFT_266032 [Acaromyces ingoldii]|uniref:Uncharacterized protein n=1 Tax=Acaromyces ingoldii TaxID=215250 RepID=A0A316YT71_9BASI|nr:hypothetical protein FA10DRAFT_266032 [Acaromyces ingoldii]PWN92236.1 hypothetical protein FA10DRAFT_266032 [Acaromyces ingoldii]